MSEIDTWREREISLSGSILPSCPGNMPEYLDTRLH